MIRGNIKIWILIHLIGFTAGVLLDFVLGDPKWAPHPVRLIGRLISDLDRLLAGGGELSGRRKRLYGIITVVIVCGITWTVTGAVMLCTRYLSPSLYFLAEAVITYYTLAAKSLRDESMAVYYPLESGDLENARYAVSMIVGRDVSALDGAGVARAAVETVAENTSDGVVAPMIYACLGGPVAAMIYKAVNTLDSMIGYRNERYEDFGRAAAKLDDLVNFLPSRAAAILMTCASFIGGGCFDGEGALRIFLRDRMKHKSPNSAQTESVCAGALGLRLGGPSTYFGKVVDKPYIGDEVRSVQPDDIVRANRLMTLTAILCFLCCEAALAGLFFLV